VAGLRPYGLLALAALCWAGNFVVARGVIEILPPVAFAFFRWVAALIFILPFARRPLAADWPAVRARAGILALLALLGISAWNALLYTAVHTTTAVNAALIQASMPAFIAALSALFFRERIRAVQWAGVLLGFAGAAVIVLRGDLRHLSRLGFVLGDLLMIAAVGCYALYSVLLRKRPAIHPLSFLAATFALGAAGLLPAYLWELLRTGPFALTRAAALSILYVALFPSIVAYFCWNQGVAGVGANRAGLFMNLIPVFAAALSIAFLGEALQAFHLAGMALIACGMSLFFLAAGGRPPRGRP
jgi:drug/metabolite transporter (DMT)-like permease